MVSCVVVVEEKGGGSLISNQVTKQVSYRAGEREKAKVTRTPQLDGIPNHDQQISLPFPNRSLWVSL